MSGLGMLDFVSPSGGEVLSAHESGLVSGDGEVFPIVDGIPRFVDSANYAAAFGLEWKAHAQTQLDSRTGTDISRRRLERCLGTPLAAVKGLRILEVGCGAGRFTELLVAAGGLIHAIDLSVAVEANRDNIVRDGVSPANYLIAQADLRQPPFPAGSFDLVICLGVLQHTPSPEESLAALWRMVVPGGQLVVDHYTWTLSLVTKLAPLYRLGLKGLPPEVSRRWCDRLVGWFFPLHWLVRNVYPAQMLLSRISPCLVYFRAFPQLSREQHYEFCRLDTYDHLTDVYKHLRTVGQIRRALRALGAIDLVAGRGGNGVEARCRKPD